VEIKYNKGNLLNICTFRRLDDRLVVMISQAMDTAVRTRQKEIGYIASVSVCTKLQNVTVHKVMRTSFQDSLLSLVIATTLA
jgi:hypothetical protein